MRTHTAAGKGRFVFVDRDGVINENREDYVKSWNEFRFIAGAKKAIRLLNEKGFKVIVVTNQSAVGRGLLSEEGLEKIHRKMMKELEDSGARIDAIYVCPHTPEERCSCRKPRIGLVEKAMEEFDINPDEAWIIGDSFSDVNLGSNAGCKPILVLTGLGKRAMSEAGITPVAVFPTVLEAAVWLTESVS